jgi:hypothetical protein
MINWEKFDNDLKNIKYNFTLIFKFFKSIKLFDDKTAVIILKYIINNNIDIFINYPFYVLCENIKIKKYPKTISSLLLFYELNKSKIKNVLLIHNWYIAYNNKIFWSKNIDEQIILLKDLKSRVQANFDCSMGGTSFGFKISQLLKNNNNKDIVIENCIERLSSVYKLFSDIFFKKANIDVITIDDFLNYTSQEQINYVNTVHIKTVKILSQVINLYEEIHTIDLKLDILVNPFIITIEEDSTECNDIEDIELILTG